MTWQIQNGHLLHIILCGSFSPHFVPRIKASYSLRYGGRQGQGAYVAARLMEGINYTFAPNGAGIFDTF
jgi:hypothetical protein